MVRRWFFGLQFVFDPFDNPARQSAPDVFRAAFGRLADVDPFADTIFNRRRFRGAVAEENPAGSDRPKAETKQSEEPFQFFHHSPLSRFRFRSRHAWSGS